MEYLSKITVANKLKHLLPKAQSLTRRALYFGLVAMTVSCILMLSLGKIKIDNFDEVAFTIAWYSIMATVYISLFAVLVLAAIFIHNKATKLPVGRPLKTEIIMLVLAVALMCFMGLITNYINPLYG